MFRVTATDDQGRTSTAERMFAVNDTLAQLTLAPSVARVRARGGRVAVAFTLARPARVRIGVATPAGVTVATVADRSFAAGRQQVVWNGRSAGGRAVPGGRYVVRVTAGNAVGEVALEAALRVRRR